jgi:hypothetical protein
MIGCCGKKIVARVLSRILNGRFVMTDTDQASRFKKRSDILGDFDDISSSIIVNNLNDNVAPMTVGTIFTNDEAEMVAINVLLLVDSSGSMASVQGLVRDGINKIVIPALQEAKDHAAIRVNAVAFNTTTYALWEGGWRSLDPTDIPEVTEASYCPMGLTHLQDSIIAAVSIMCGRAAEVTEETGTLPKNLLVVLSDGADRGSTATVEGVKRIVKALDDKLFLLGFIYFDTGEYVDGKEMALELGFPSALDIKGQSGETEEAIKGRFREAFDLMSQSIIGVGKDNSLSTQMIQSTGGAGLFD